MKRQTILSLSLAFVAAVPSLGLAQGMRPGMSPNEPMPDPRVGLKAGWWDAGVAAWNMRLVSNTQPSDSFIDRAHPGNFGFINSDVTFSGNHVIQGNFSGYQVWDVSDPAHVTLTDAYVCPGSQSDVSVYKNLMFVSSEDTQGRMDCGRGGVQDTVSHERIRGIRVFDISDISHPRYLTNVQTCRGSHTHTVVNDPRDSSNIYIYISGSAPVRSPNELAGCSAAQPDQDPNTALFRIEVIKVPVAHPEQAAVVSSARIFDNLTPAASHGAAAEDIAHSAQVAADARAHGGFTATIQGSEQVAPAQFTKPLLDSIMHARGGTGDPTAADSAALRTGFQAIVDRMVSGPPGQVRRGPSQCHDITVYPAIGRAGGACGGYGLLLDISDPAHPRRIGAAADSNFSFWHSATFNNDGTKILFSDEWGGGLQPRCRPSDKMEWGADAIFTLQRDTMNFHSYYKMPAQQTANENCVAHNGSLIPVPGRDIMAQGWYQGGVSVFDWTDASHPMEIAYFDRGPMDSTKLQGAGSWSAYWYNGYIYSSEIARGLDIFDLQPSALLSENEIDAAKTVHVDFLNVQDQQRFTWAPSFVVARAYVDQLERSHGLSASRITAVRASLEHAEQASGAARKTALRTLGTQLNGEAARSSDTAKVRLLAGTVHDMAGM
ncbi:MAG TPA: hypothetical protein VGI92_00680 [Gemmatimonadales bacterium]